MLTLIVTAGIGLGALAGTDASVRSNVRARTQEVVQTTTNLAAQIQAELRPGEPQSGTTAQDRLQLQTQTRTQTELHTRSQQQLGADDAAGPNIEMQTRTETRTQTRSEIGDGPNLPRGPQLNLGGTGQGRAGR
jgi:hypothetical protein